MKREIIRADVLGYCMGVRRAVDTAVRCLETYKKQPVYSFGPLIHNKSALDSLAASGLKLLDVATVSTSEPGVVIIRAHGIPPETHAVLQNAGYIIEDATCPRVLANQKKAASYAMQGYTVIIAGDRNHGEVVGLEGCVRFASKNESCCILVENRTDAQNLMLDGVSLKKAVLISQTTMSRLEYDAIAVVLKSRIPSLLVLDTVCPATQERQDALLALCSKVEGLLIIGGKNSANTQRLLTTAQKNSTHAAHIENASEIPDEFFALKKIGLAAGASTPDFVIDEVEACLQN